MKQHYISKSKKSCCSRFSRWTQNKSYDWMASTIWDSIVSGFKPGRLIAIKLLNIQPNDKLLLIGEGSGLDFECLPKTMKKSNIKAFDYSREMVKQAKIKAKFYGIPQKNCFVGDAQELPFIDEKFDKIYFPLSLASIPNPTLALKEAERVLAIGGRIVIFDKMVDEGKSISCPKTTLNLFTSSIFADISRKLPDMMKTESPLKIIHYESLSNKLSGRLSNLVSGSYRIAVLVRKIDFPEKHTVKARI